MAGARSSARQLLRNLARSKSLSEEPGASRSGSATQPTASSAASLNFHHASSPAACQIPAVMPHAIVATHHHCCVLQCLCQFMGP